MLTIQITCSHHQRNDSGYGREEEFVVATINEQTQRNLTKHLEARDWVVQFNGDYMDTYCSKKCAE